MLIKPLGTVISISTADTCSNSTLVYIQNTTAGSVLVSTSNGTATTSSLYVLANTTMLYRKVSTDTIQGTGVYATQAAFTN
jgi:hypothetical protein